jgi:hypothetical protein
MSITPFLFLAFHFYLFSKKVKVLGHLNYESCNNHNMANRNLTTISVSHENYFLLKQLGNTGESFNDVLTRVLKSITPTKGDQTTDT